MHCIDRQTSTHKNPLKNLQITSIAKFVARLDKSVARNDRINVGTITLLRPLLSAKKPQKCELTIMPIDDIPLSTPLFCVESERSHSATGNTKLMPKIIYCVKFAAHICVTYPLPFSFLSSFSYQAFQKLLL